MALTILDAFLNVLKQINLIDLMYMKAMIFQEDGKNILSLKLFFQMLKYIKIILLMVQAISPLNI